MKTRERKKKLSAFFFQFEILSEAKFKEERWINMAEELPKLHEMICTDHINWGLQWELEVKCRAKGCRKRCEKIYD